ncbi:MAG: type II/IV secretion system protein [Planctomycetota bacterium]|nr:MAG: type II/IV secretion system protein [Planctomycetota bacterium]
MALGAILLSQGLISDEQLAHAESERKRSGERLEQALARLGIASSEQTMRALAQELALPFVRLDETDIDDSAVELVPPRLVFRLRALPFSRSNGRLLVATSDPLRLDGFEQICVAAGMPISLVVVDDIDLGVQIRTRFGVAGDVLEALGAGNDSSADSRVESAESEDASEASVVRLVNDLLVEAIRERATDIHIEPYEHELQVRYRIDGVMSEAGVPATIHRFRHAITSRLKIMANLNISEKRRPQDGRITFRQKGQEFDLRLSVIPMLHGEGVVLRILSKSAALAGLDELGMPPSILAPWCELVANPHGIVLVTGPTGSGKSTTLYASLTRIVTGEVKAITVEDPVEYHVPGVNQIQVNHAVGLDFATGLRAILRHDPDIIMIGEIRDAETANAAVQASLTGHLVLSTLHTNDAATAATRLLDMGIEPFLVASTVEGVLAQRLLRRVCRECSVARPPHAGEIPPDFVLAQDGLVAEAVGCRACRGSGYRGRIGCYELLVVDESVRSEIMKRTSSAAISAAAKASNRLTSLRDSAAELVAARMTTAAEALGSVKAS